ncbi:c-type cytochrome domain-containing protein [Roseibacillus ishigakijimensis]|uniref:Cytochrome C Planctomycete-type domain-containing protein n=1 Tax=Roseibacillus ishigakijimensis TaxID=454146 RepID=A0A934RQ25_9BACT|nr:c-type cytochrome domain-containing protein [Roseibacillus ishigakijimensis]MBK1834880.1 hypothetical protein [Roseibacillus ishigakijimensis]
MRATTSILMAGGLLLASCGPNDDSESKLKSRPVLSPRLQAETQSYLDFARHVKPILEERCVWCHDGSDKKMPYSLVNREKAFAGKRIVPGQPEKSLLYLAASGEHPTLQMPAVGVQVAATDLEVLRRWIATGAVWPMGSAGELRGR